MLADEILKEELLSNGITREVDIIWIDDVDEFTYQENADGCIDLLFDNTKERIELLKKLSSQPVIVNSVIDTLEEINAPFVRINAWPGFLKRNVAEVCTNNEVNKNEAEKILSLINRKAEWVPDVKGFISARVVSMIINEAYFALEEKVSTKEEIDIAMKLGTNYPYGPFEWSKKIGLKNIAVLLTELSLTEKRYQPASLLLKESKEL